jgi:hypothetical protein
MDGRNAIKFCVRAGLSVTETSVSVQKAFGNEALNRSDVFRWYSQFRDIRELVEDDERGGCPKLTQTEVNIAAVADLIKSDHRMTSRMIAESLNILMIAVIQILKEDLGKRKLCACFVPHSLTNEQREDRVTSCQDIMVMADGPFAIQSGPCTQRFPLVSSPKETSCWEKSLTMMMRCKKKS